MNINFDLLCDVHLGLPLPPKTKPFSNVYVKGSYKYYHYGCDGLNDRGWGCGYRTLQTLCSWVHNSLSTTKSVSVKEVPSICDIQKTLVNLEDKPPSFSGSREWIGSVEVCLVIDAIYNVSSRIVHISSGNELKAHALKLTEHFQNYGSPIMMGGDRDASSKGIMGICETDEEFYLLVVDPHFYGKICKRDILHADNWVHWRPLSEFLDSSFYNLCLPQLKAVC